MIDIQYFKERVKIDINTGCWNWKLGRDKKGYGKAYIRTLGKKRAYLVHRLSYRYLVGDFDNTLFVCHKCDNPSCCNPDHLFTGTAKDNTDDMINKGRTNFVRQQLGNNYRGKKLIAGGIEFKNYREAGKYFGISDNGIRKRIKLGWKGYYPA